MKARVVFMALAVGALLAGGGQAANRLAAGSEIALPAPRLTGPLSVEAALARRRSVRDFASRGLTLSQLGQLAWAAQGITEPRRGLRTAPSAGALYPLQLYLVTREAVYRYLPQGHRLLVVAPADRKAALAEAALGQACVRGAPLVVVMAADLGRTQGKYGARGERYVHIEAGHVGQNLHLQAVALGLGSVSVGAFDDGAVARVLGLPAGQRPVYLIAVGAKAG